MGALPKMWTGLILLSLALLSRAADGENNEIAPDGTISVEPLSVVPPPLERSSGSTDVAPPSQPQPGPGKGPGPGPGSGSGPGSGPGSGSGPGPHDLSGTSTETKNPDGSTITVTHFRGNLPQSSFHNFGGFPAWNHVPSPYFYPWGPHPGQGLPLPFNPNGNFRSQQPFQPNNGGSGPPFSPAPVPVQVPAPEKTSS